MLSSGHPGEAETVGLITADLSRLDILPALLFDSITLDRAWHQAPPPLYLW